MSFWTDERIADFRQCVGAGMSAKATAAFLTHRHGHITRNACISKSHRMGLKFHGDRFEHLRGERRPRKQYRPKRTKRGMPQPPQPPLSITQADHDIPAEQRKQLLELTNQTCRYPIGEPEDPGFFFCGAPEADIHEHRPYCARHSRITTNRHRPLNLSPAEHERRRRWANQLWGSRATSLSSVS